MQNIACSISISRDITLLARLMIGSRITILNPISYIKAVQDLMLVVMQFRSLLWELSKREIKDRYVGQILGSLWAFLQPILLMAIYLIIFGWVFQVRVGHPANEMAQSESGNYAVFLLSGLIPWIAFQDVMNRATQSILGNANLVKQIIFPVEMLPLKLIFPTILIQLASTAILAVYIFINKGIFPVLILTVPFLVALQILAMTGLALFLASVTPFFRDLKDIVQMLCTVLIFMMPIFYSLDMVPVSLRPIIIFNPWTHMVLCFQDAMYWGKFLHPWSWLVFGFASLISLMLGARVFNKLKQILGNVL